MSLIQSYTLYQNIFIFIVIYITNYFLNFKSLFSVYFDNIQQQKNSLELRNILQCLKKNISFYEEKLYEK